MKKRKMIAFISIAISLIVVAIILIDVYVLDETKDLRPGLVEFTDDSQFNIYTVKFFNGDNGDDDVNELAGVYFRISEEYDNQNAIYIQIWHEEDTHLDGLKLSFPNILSHRLMFILPTGFWPPMEFGQTEDGKGSIVYIPDFGFIGEGTVVMQFHLQSDNPEESLCYIDMQLSEDKGLKTIKYNAETNMEITIPGEI